MYLWQTIQFYPLMHHILQSPTKATGKSTNKEKKKGQMSAMTEKH
jgi:hypothetical protein